MAAQQRILRGKFTADFPPARFRRFDSRPVNYFCDVLNDEQEPAANHSEIPTTLLEEKLAQETARLRQLATDEAEKRFREGLERGRAEAEQELARARELLIRYAELLQAEKAELAARLEPQSVKLAFSIARKILGRELDLRPESVADILRTALKQVLDSEHIRARVNREDFDYLRTVQNDLERELNRHTRFELVPDSSVERGGCIIETERGLLDAQISTQLEMLWNSLNEATLAGEQNL